MRFLIIEKIQNQNHIRAARASLVSAERLRNREYKNCEVVPFACRKFRAKKK